MPKTGLKLYAQVFASQDNKEETSGTVSTQALKKQTAWEEIISMMGQNFNFSTFNFSFY